MTNDRMLSVLITHKCYALRQMSAYIINESKNIPEVLT